MHAEKEQHNLEQHNLTPKKEIIYFSNQYSPFLQTHIHISSDEQRPYTPKLFSDISQFFFNTRPRVVATCWLLIITTHFINTYAGVVIGCANLPMLAQCSVCVNSTVVLLVCWLIQRGKEKKIGKKWAISEGNFPFFFLHQNFTTHIWNATTSTTPFDAQHSITSNFCFFVLHELMFWFVFIRNHHMLAFWVILWLDVQPYRHTDSPPLFIFSWACICRKESPSALQQRTNLKQISFRNLISTKHHPLIPPPSLFDSSNPRA